MATRALGFIEQYSGKVAADLGKGIDRFLKEAKSDTGFSRTKKVARGAASATRRASVPLAFEVLKNTSLWPEGYAFPEAEQDFQFAGRDAAKYKEFARVAREITELARNPALLSEVVSGNLMGIQTFAPGHAEVMGVKLANVVGFLSQKLPRAATLPSAFSRPWRPTDEEMNRFSRYLRASLTPLQVYEEFTETGVLAKETVESWKAVWPEKHQEIREKIFENIEAAKKLPYQKRIAISQMFDIPLEPAMANIQILQSAGKSQQGQEESKRNRPPFEHQRIGAVASAETSDLEKVANPLPTDR
jgi:hypothetical protein